MLQAGITALATGFGIGCLSPRLLDAMRFNQRYDHLSADPATTTTVLFTIKLEWGEGGKRIE